MKTADTIDRYLLRFRLALTGAKDKEELVSEIRSHIVERLEDHSRPVHEIVEDTLTALGTPEVLATRYRTEGLLERASTTMSPVLLLRATMRWAMTGIRGFFAFWVLFLGYFMAAGFYVSAALKPFFSDRLGFWVGAHGFGIMLRPSGGGDTEILGMWFAPVTLALGCLCIIGTTKFVRWLISRRRHTNPTTPATA